MPRFRSLISVSRIRHAALVAAASSVLATAACGPASSSPPAADGTVTPVYNKDTGRLEELVSDRDGDGKNDTRAFMKGAVPERIEIDTNNDGTPDRIEYYIAPAAGAADSRPLLSRAEEKNAKGQVVRREDYEAGVLVRVAEDTDGNARADKWEIYTAGTLVRVDLDLAGSGKPDRRLIYGASGALEAMQEDPDGDGTFAPVAMPSGR